ncbi:cation transporter, partial [Myxococcota bacterium]|nr:cation transporter [Myxococcota bacterium]
MPRAPHDAHRHDGPPHGAEPHGPVSGTPAEARARLAWVLVLVVGYAVVELVGGFWTGSLALL